MKPGPDEYRVVRYEPRLRTAVCRLQQLHWTPDLEVNSAYFGWKYERNPYLSEPHVYLAMRDDEVVGMRGVYGARWEVGVPARTFDAPCAADLVVSPEHRGRGVFTRIMEYALADLGREDVEWLFNLSASAATRLGSLGMHWSAAGPIERMVRRATAREAPRRALGRLLRGARRLGGVRGGVVLSDMARPAAMAELLERAGRDGRIRHVRDTEYFAWRFQNPLSTYRFVFLGLRRLAAYLVLRSPRHGGHGRSTWIADWAGESTGARLRVLAAALELRGRFELWSGALGEADRDELRRAGFTERPITSFAEYYPCVLVRPVAPDPPPPPWRLDGVDLLDTASWDVRLLDSDGT